MYAARHSAAARQLLQNNSADRATGLTVFTKADIYCPVRCLGLQSTPPHEQSLRRNKQLLVANIRDRGEVEAGLRPKKECLRVHGRYVSFCAGDEARDRNPTRGPAAGRLSRRESAVDRSHCSAEEGEGSGERGRLDLMSDNDAKCIAETPEQQPRRGMGWDVREIRL